MKNLTAVILTATTALIFGCSHSGGVSNYLPDETLASAGDNSSMPRWAEKGEVTPFWIDDGKVYSVGIATINGDERVEAGSRISENNARGTISKAVENKMEFIFQQGDELDARTAKFIGSEVSVITSSQMQNGGQWWKKIATSSEDGSRHVKTVIYSMIVMPEKDFQAAVYKAANKAVAQNQVSPEFKDQLKKQWDRFVENSPSLAPRTPSSQEVPVENTDKE